jgi:hypothetical protein
MTTTGPPTRALTVIQPWAWAIANGIKTVENRSWSTSYRGTIYVHAGVKLLSAEFDQCARLLEKTGLPRHVLPGASSLVYGALIATVEIVSCGRFPDDPWAAPDSSQWHWKLANAKLLESPIPMRGSLGLWEIKS